MLDWLVQLAADLESLLLPAVCARCSGEPGPRGALCPRCDAALPRLARGACTRCQEAPARAGEAHRRCGACAAQAGPLFACLAAAPFAGEPADWIRRFKYPRPGLVGLDPAAEAVVRLLVVEAAGRAPASLPDAVVPMPQHPARLRARGFHPAALLARAVARRHGLPLAPWTLERVRDTPSQTGLDRMARQRNVAGAFRASQAVAGARLWLVDDVITTGASVGAAARALRHAGAVGVVALAAARTPAGFAGPSGKGYTERSFDERSAEWPASSRRSP